MGYDPNDPLSPSECYAAGEPGSDLVEFEQGRGYHIYMSQDAVLTVSGSPITADRQIALIRQP